MKPRSLPERKQILVAQSAALRQELSGTIDEIESGVRGMLGWIDAGVKTGNKLKQGGIWVAAAGGLLLGWRWLRGRKAAPARRESPSFLGSLIGGGLKTAGWMATAMKIWRNVSAFQEHFTGAPHGRHEEEDGHRGVTPRFKT